MLGIIALPAWIYLYHNQIEHFMLFSSFLYIMGLYDRDLDILVSMPLNILKLRKDKPNTLILEVIKLLMVCVCNDTAMKVFSYINSILYCSKVCKIDINKPVLYWISFIMLNSWNDLCLHLLNVVIELEWADA